jgi:hypothetical protein
VVLGEKASVPMDGVFGIRVHVGKKRHRC